MKFLNDQKLIHNLSILAQNAGSAILKLYQDFQLSSLADKKNFVHHKSDNSPLTIADLKSNKILTKGLMDLVPDIPIVSEENEDSWRYRKPNSTFWIIDPLDGTKEFLACSGEFTVNIGLIHNARTVFGMIYAPVNDELYWGSPMWGTYKQCAGTLSKQLLVKPLGQSIRIIASKSHLTAQTLQFVQKIKFPYKLLQAGSSLKFCRIAEGNADVYPRFGPTCEWDTAAGQAILEGAGGFVQTENGNRLNYGKQQKLNPNFIASNVPFKKCVNNA